MAQDKDSSLSDRAYRLIKKAIINHQLQAGELYSATELGDWLGVSRTPIREAAQQLEKIGMVRVEKNRGIRILSTSFEELIEAFEIRLLLEVPLMRYLVLNRTESDCKVIESSFHRFYEAAATNDPQKTLEADRDYHLTLLKLVGNERVIRIIEHTRNSVLYSGPSTVPSSRTCLEAFEDHRALHDAIIKGDSQQAEKAMEAHILNTAKKLIEQESKLRPEWEFETLIERLSWIR